MIIIICKCFSLQEHIGRVSDQSSVQIKVVWKFMN